MQKRENELYALSDQKVDPALRLNVVGNSPFPDQEYSVLYVTVISDIPGSYLGTRLIW